MAASIICGHHFTRYPLIGVVLTQLYLYPLLNTRISIYLGKMLRRCKKNIKKGSPLPLITTSATTKNENTFHEKSSGWCFSLSHLQRFFANCDVSFDAKSCERSLIDSEVFLKRLDPYYYQDKESFCHRKRISCYLICL